MWELLTSGTTPWVIIVASGLITSWWGFKKIRYENKMENERIREEKRLENEKIRYENKLVKFKETNENLFKNEKQQVLAAIATLNVFKNDPEFEKNTIDVLLNRLYTELDYDIINAILSTLIQASDKDELLYIASGLIDINRNFFIQKYPIEQRVSDLEGLVLKEKKETEPSDFVSAIKKSEIETGLRKEYENIFSLKEYKILWHKQVTADAFAIFMRKAYLANKNTELEMKLFQNDFNYAYLAQVKTTKTDIERSAFGYSMLVKVDFDNIYSYRNEFDVSTIYDSGFRNGKMIKTKFAKVHLENTVFENIEFQDCSFQGAKFRETSFINCKGLKQEDFKDALRFDDDCKFPAGITVEHHIDYEKRIANTYPQEFTQKITQENQHA